MEYKKTTQAIAYLVGNAPQGADCSKLSIFKLLFLADRYSLRMYGQALTDDVYVAMKYGPVPSKSKELIEGYVDSEEQQGYFYSYLSVNNNVLGAVEKADLSQFCDYDVDALNAVLRVWRTHPTPEQLVNYTHQFPEWKELEEKVRKRKLPIISVKKFFQSSVKEDYCPADEKRLRVSWSLWQRNTQIQKALR